MSKTISLLLLLAFHCHTFNAGRSSPFLGLRALKQQKKEAMLAGKNVILFLTDQERPTMHFPDGWVSGSAEESMVPSVTVPYSPCNISIMIPA